MISWKITCFAIDSSDTHCLLLLQLSQCVSINSAPMANYESWRWTQISSGGNGSAVRMISYYTRNLRHPTYMPGQNRYWEIVQHTPSLSSNHFLIKHWDPCIGWRGEPSHNVHTHYAMCNHIKPGVPLAFDNDHTNGCIFMNSCILYIIYVIICSRVLWWPGQDPLGPVLYEKWPCCNLCWAYHPVLSSQHSAWKTSSPIPSCASSLTATSRTSE